MIDWGGLGKLLLLENYFAVHVSMITKYYTKTSSIFSHLRCSFFIAMIYF